MNRTNAPSLQPVPQPARSCFGQERLSTKTATRIQRDEDRDPAAAGIETKIYLRQVPSRGVDMYETFGHVQPPIHPIQGVRCQSGL